MQNFEELFITLQAATGKKVRKEASKLTDEYEHMLTIYEGTCEDSVEFLLSVFRDKDLCDKPGVDMFAMMAGNELFLMSDAQKKSIYSTLRNMYQNYNNLDFCWVVGDLIARNYERKEAMDFFSSEFPKSTHNGKEGIALGLDIIARQEGRSAEVNKMIDRILKT
ncbi:hypothetical protein [Pseudomonas sp. NPDC089401]|uniref:hypothetical protein n=1 Tax=Pseudomonas sp. NPDC089401 TaxID=3364462 RepID=UPI0038142268